MSGLRSRNYDASWIKAACVALRCPPTCLTSSARTPRKWRTDLWRLIGQCSDLDWLLLTKRPQNIAKMLPELWSVGWPHWPNVWIGTTVENQNEAEKRTKHLSAVPARVRFLSCEPLIEAIEPDLDGISWVICGESGGHARIMEERWAGRLRDQCAAHGAAFFLKQRTSKKLIPADLRVRQFPAAA